MNSFFAIQRGLRPTGTSIATGRPPTVMVISSPESGVWTLSA
jgi:hypothetical protein